MFDHPIGMGQPTHVLVDTLQHPAVELTQAEGAAVDSSDVSDASSASSSSSNSLDLVSDYLTDDWMIIITGVIGGCVGCILLLAIVSVTTRRCYNNRHSSRRHKHNQQHRDSSGLNNSESSSEKGCYGDPTITSDNMILTHTFGSGLAYPLRTNDGMIVSEAGTVNPRADSFSLYSNFVAN